MGPPLAQSSPLSPPGGSHSPSAPTPVVTSCCLSVRSLHGDPLSPFRFRGSAPKGSRSESCAPGAPTPHPRHPADPKPRPGLQRSRLRPSPTAPRSSGSAIWTASRRPQRLQRADHAAPCWPRAPPAGLRRKSRAASALDSAGLASVPGRGSRQRDSAPGARQRPYPVGEVAPCGGGRCGPRNGHTASVGVEDSGVTAPMGGVMGSRGAWSHLPLGVGRDFLATGCTPIHAHPRPVPVGLDDQPSSSPLWARQLSKGGKWEQGFCPKPQRLSPRQSSSPWGGVRSSAPPSSRASKKRAQQQRSGVARLALDMGEGVADFFYDKGAAVPARSVANTRQCILALGGSSRHRRAWVQLSLAGSSHAERRWQGCWQEVAVRVRKT